MCKGNGMDKYQTRLLYQARCGAFEGAQLGVLLAAIAILVWLAPRIPAQ